MTRRPVLTIWLLTLAVATAACEDRRADKAYLRGDYGTAVKDLQSLANAGEARAQYDLGVLYDKGQGVPQSDQEALQWYQRAAERGEPRAQYNLGLMYLKGQGVQPNLVQAYYWVSLSAGHGHTHALDARDYISEKMTVEQIVEGKRLVGDHEEQVKKQNACLLCRVFRGAPAP